MAKPQKRMALVPTNSRDSGASVGMELPTDWVDYESDRLMDQAQAERACM